MLVRLSIRDIVLIDALDLDFSGGLTTLTGETGAGKSILLDAFVLALGGRGDAALVRAGQPRGEVRASFETRADHPASIKARELGIAADGELILRREQTADGRTRAYVNDTPVSAQALRAIGQELVEIHCQHDERAMVDPAAHRQLVDAHGGLTRQVDALRALHGAMQAARRALKEEEERLAKARADADYLRHAHAELTELAPEPGEEERLAERRLAMQRAEKVAVDLRDALGAFEGDHSIVWSLAQAARRLERRATQAAELLDPPLRALSSALDALGLAQQSLEEALDAANFDPRDLENIEERLFALRGLARKHRISVDALPDLARRIAEGIALIEAGEARVAALAREAEDAVRAYNVAALELSHARRMAAKKLDALVDAELKPLKLEGAHFHTTIASDPESGGPEGIDRVEFWVQTNPGSRPGPLTKVASGGELARFLLALKVVLADRGSAPTLVFDEIDTGVGGAVADAIGQRLARLASRVQVLAVTHAPQVAARATAHLRIAKGAISDKASAISDKASAKNENAKEKRVATSVTPLAHEERQEEIARMLAGATITDEARAAAARLLKGAG
jgi:DNA repair protein RecN (Recombination protein N)